MHIDELISLLFPAFAVITAVMRGRHVVMTAVKTGRVTAIEKGVFFYDGLLSHHTVVWGYLVYSMFFCLYDYRSFSGEKR